MMRADVRQEKRLGRAFFARDAEEVARDLIGTLLVRSTGRREYRARIVETEAYVGTHDLASHSSKGRTKRTEVMFGPAGRAYVYLIYGRYEMFNIVTGPEGSGQAVLIRAAEPLEPWSADLSGPGRLASAFRITRRLNGIDLTAEGALFLIGNPGPSPRIKRSKRVGCEYAGLWKDALLRFFDADSRAVTRK